ncbi:MAG: hypothetical protein CMA25_07420 [Euryarchaeota archaeon]|nr:hypothetical protein [Euryarchaeota archaeon]|tara:strand:- start:190 stop:627 length:438 start_codon:yes stop_codon:yes gene_type:complete
MDDDLVARYRLEAKAAMNQESERRRQEYIDPAEEDRLRNLSLHDLEDLVPALMARLGDVRLALDGHGGGIEIVSRIKTDDGLDLVLDLSGACLACGAAPGTLEGIKSDLENDSQISRIRFSKKLLQTFDEISREFVEKHSQVEFV